MEDLLDGIRHWTLQNVEDGYRYGILSMDAVEAYLQLWNATPGRFTIAEWRDGAIRQIIRR